ncbi:hypothetical protein [Bordetella genomosp. 13]|uniref:COG4648 family protein n=1 Tax=Bordetella genomosp. 13 TaxID=463040 RepID=UPI0011A2F5D3|nr:hypothetical protein [Bordetella genomosp. 13]
MTRRLFAFALVLLGLAYPFAVYVGLQHGAARWIAVPLAALWLARALTAPATQPGGRLLPVLALAFCLVLAIAQGDGWLRWYPVLINAGLLAVFGASLLRGMPVIERLARLREPDLPPSGVRYTRRVTVVWTLFFAANGLAAAALAEWGSWDWWTLYNGCISYVLIGALLAGEWLVRPLARKAA